MTFTRLFTGDDNQSHFENHPFTFIEIEMGKITTSFSAGHLFFGEIENMNEITWHNSPCRQFIVMLEGAMEIEVGDGSKKIFNVGDVLLAEDLIGQGHITRAASKGKRRYLAISLI